MLRSFKKVADENPQCKEVARALKCGGAFDNVAIVAETLKMLQILQSL